MLQLNKVAITVLLCAVSCACFVGDVWATGRSMQDELAVLSGLEDVEPKYFDVVDTDMSAMAVLDRNYNIRLAPSAGAIIPRFAEMSDKMRKRLIEDGEILFDGFLPNMEDVEKLLQAPVFNLTRYVMDWFLSYWGMLVASIFLILGVRWVMLEQMVLGSMSLVVYFVWVALAASSVMLVVGNA